MDSNKAFATIKRYRTQFAMGALVLFTVLTVGVIYFIRQSSGPLAPTAPTSRPGAIVAACTTDFLLQPECLDLEFVASEEASGSAEASGSGELKSGAVGTFVCEGLPGTTNYKFEYKDSEDGDFEELSSGSENESDELEIGDYIEVKCTTCAGDYCASATNVAQNCTLNATEEVVIPSPSPTPSPSPSPSPTPSPRPTPSPTPPTGFRIEKFHDRNGDGTRQSGEEGLTWDFEWRIRGDNDWEDYTTDEDDDGKGDTVDDLDPGKIVEIREEDVNGWKHTTDDEKTLTLVAGEILVARFGNQRLPGSPTPLPRCGSECDTNSDCPSNLTCSSGQCRNPQCTGESDCSCNTPSSPRPSASPQPEIPVSGSTTQTAGLLVVGLGVIALGFFQFYKRLKP